MKQPIRIIIHVEGGLVQGVYTDCSNESIPIEAIIYDYDTEGACEDSIVTLESGDEAFGFFERVVHDPELVREVFNAFNLEQ